MTGLLNAYFAGLLALAACLLATPALAEGECRDWNVAGSWHIAQSNGTEVTLRLQQTGAQLSGVGEYSYYNNDTHRVQTVGGPIEGALENGNLVRVTVFWSNSTAGHYTGQVEPDGGMTGYTVDQNDPNNRATFRASGYAQCLARVTVAPPARTGLQLGRVQPRPGSPPSPARTMCEMAVSARARNSPAAPALENLCAAQGGPPPSVAFGRVPPPSAPTPPTPEPTAEAPPVDPADLDRLAATGADIAALDPPVMEARNAQSGAFYRSGFDVATALFGDPALGAQGNTRMGPGSQRIRAALGAAGQRGFDDSVTFHRARGYAH